jgi:VanZ family protein
MPVIIWAGVIFFMSTRSFGSSFSNHILADILGFLHIEVSNHAFYLLATGFRKLGHFTEYGILAIFLYYALGDENRSAWNSRRALACILLAGLYSLTDEFHQRFVPNRGPSIVDCGFDTIGATLGILIVYLVSKKPVKPGEESLQGQAGRNGPAS